MASADAEPDLPSLPDELGGAGGFLAALAHSAGAAVAYVDASERIRFITDEAAAWLGMKPREAIGKTLREVHEPASYAFFEPHLRRALAGERAEYQRASRHADGSLLWISVSLAPHRDASGRVLGLFTCALEVSELKRTHDALGRALEELASHMENTPLAVVEFDAELRIRRWSSQAAGIFGWAFEEVRGKRTTDFPFIHHDSVEHVRGLTRGLIEGTERRNRVLARNLTRDGRAIWCEWYNSSFFDESGKLASILALGQDVTARVDSEEQLKQAAVHDALTGLPNRNALAARLEHALLRVNRAGDRLALLFIDLDRFKKVNDTLGHAAGDDVLRQAAGRIRACVREVDTVARLGGDEFVVLLETDVRPDTPGIIGERVRAAFATPFEYKGAEVRCGASVGVSLYPDHARDPDALLASADQAMYRVKNAG
jgi:diguanylate cyclase (GGDEF)-like protein/PAS domain S-box-containing protein